MTAYTKTTWANGDTITQAALANLETQYDDVFTGGAFTGLISVTVSSAVALTVANTGTNYGFQVDTSTASSATGLKVKSAAAAGGLAVSVISSGTDENLTLNAKGAGTITLGSVSTGQIVLATKTSLLGTYTTPQSYTPAGAATSTMLLNSSDVHFITMPAGNITIALSGPTTGQSFVIRILQDSVGSRTVTWFSTIRWAGGSAPTLTTTANKVDVIGFLCTGGGTYDGAVLMANV